MGSMIKICSLLNSTQEGHSADLCPNTCNDCSSRYNSMCSVLDDDEIQLISNISKDIFMSPKKVIFNEGETTDHLFSIKHGFVRISKMLSDGRRQIVGFLFPGEIFGMICGNGYNYSAESLTNVELCRMPRTKVFEQFSALPKLSSKILDITRTELQKTLDVLGPNQLDIAIPHKLDSEMNLSESIKHLTSVMSSGKYFLIGDFTKDVYGHHYQYWSSSVDSSGNNYVAWAYYMSGDTGTFNGSSRDYPEPHARAARRF